MKLPTSILVVALISLAQALEPAPTCTFRATPNPVYVGQSTSMACACNPAASQTWVYKLTSEGVWDAAGPFAMDNALVLRGVQKSDAGRYQCWAKFAYPDRDFQGGNSVKVNLDLRVQDPPNPPKKTWVNVNPNTVVEGKSFTVECKITSGGPATRFIFYRNNAVYKVVNVGSTTRTTITVGTAIKQQDEGNYKCIASTPEGTSQPENQETLKVLLITFRTSNCDRRKYVFHGGRLTQNQAKQYCQGMSMNLAVYNDARELKEVNDALRRAWSGIANTPIWTGYTRARSTDPWTDGVCNNFSPLYPNLSSSGGKCAASVGGSSYSVKSCNDRYPFMCMAAKCDVDVPSVTYQNDRYIIFNRKVDRPRAEAICKGMGLGLFSFNTLPEMMAVCEPLLAKKLSHVPYWTSPKLISGKYIDTCNVQIPAPIMTVFQDDATIQGAKCTILKDDLYFAVPCAGTCVGFVCEKNPDGC